MPGDERDRYHLAEELGYFQGVLRVNPKGFGFIDLDDISYYVAKENLHLGMDQDVVAARILKDTARSTECEVVRILEHHNKRFVGVVKKDRDRFYFLSDKDLAGRRILSAIMMSFRWFMIPKSLLRSIRMAEN